MSYDHKKAEHGFTAIEKAMFDVQVSFTIDEPQYTWNMIRKAMIISQKPEIKKELARYMMTVTMQRERIRVYHGLTASDRIMRVDVAEREYLREQNYVFLEKLVEQLSTHELWYCNRGPPTRTTGLKDLEEKLKYNRG